MCFESLVCFSLSLFLVCHLFGTGSTGYFLYVVQFYRIRQRGMLKQVAGGTGCAEISSHTIGMDFGEFRVARRFAECAC